MPPVSLFEPPARWHVASESKPTQPNTVDVTAFRGFGECSCEHFQYRMLPDLQAGKIPATPRCRHIIMAREAFAIWMIQYLNTPAHQRPPLP